MARQEAVKAGLRSVSTANDARRSTALAAAPSSHEQVQRRCAHSEPLRTPGKVGRTPGRRTPQPTRRPDAAVEHDLQQLTGLFNRT